jgi:hypothetical protein
VKKETMKELTDYAQNTMAVLSRAAVRDALDSDARLRAELRRLRKENESQQAVINAATRHMSSHATATLFSEARFALAKSAALKKPRSTRGKR